MQTSPSGRASIARREGAKLTAYQDSVGIWTVGVGHTSAAGPPKVTKGMRITAAESDEILARDLAAVEASINALVEVPLSQNEFDALVSLVFNIGAGAFKKSTVLRSLNGGNRTGAADAMLAWNKGTVSGKKVALKGLTTRRQDERAQFLSKTPVETTVTITLPTAPEPTKPPVQMPDKPIVLTQEGTDTPVVQPGAPTPEAAKPTVARSKTGILTVIALAVSALVAYFKAHFGG
jgi:lysozyme